MTDRNAEIEKLIEDREKKRILERLQRDAEEKGAIPRLPDLVLHRYRLLMESAGGAVLGICAGIVTVYFNFVLFVYLLHVEF